MAKGTALRSRLGVKVVVNQAGMNGLGRDVAGRFTSAQGDIAKVNERLARDLATSISRALEEGRLDERREARTGRLSAAITSPENRRSNKDGFGVGVPAYLNEAAPYWELLNDGTSRFVGRRIRFLRGYPSGGPDPHGAGLRMAAQRDEYGQFRSLARQEAIIKRPIRAEHYFERGVDAFDLPTRMREALQEALGRYGFRVQ